MKKRDMVVINFKKFHGMAAGTKKWIEAKRESDGSLPTMEGSKNFTFLWMDGIVEVRGQGMAFGIKAIVADHFKVLVGDMADQAFNKRQSGKCFVNKDIVFVAIVMKSDRSAIVGINTGSSNDWTAKIAADILSNLIGITDIIFSINVKTIWTGFIDEGLNRIKRGTDMGSKAVKQGGSKGKAEKFKVKVRNFAPGSAIACPAFRNKHMNVGVPF